MQYRTWGLDEIVLQQSQIMIAPDSVLVRASEEGSVCRDISMFAYSHRTFRMLFKEPYPGCDSFRQKAIIMIKKQNILAPAVQDTVILAAKTP